jgi:hypothetical protein
MPHFLFFQKYSSKVFSQFAARIDYWVRTHGLSKFKGAQRKFTFGVRPKSKLTQKLTSKLGGIPV